MDNKLTAIIAVLVVIMLGAGVYLALGTSSDSNDDSEEGNDEVNDHYPVTVQSYDDNNNLRDVTFDKKPTKVLVMWSSTVEVMVHFGLGDLIVGAVADPDDTLGMEEHYADYKKVNFLGEVPDVEKARACDPDLVIGWSSTFAAPGEWSIGTHQFWNDLGVNTYVFNSPNKDMNDYYGHIADIGKIFDCEDKTNAYIEQLKGDTKKITDLTKDLKDDERKTFLTLQYGVKGPICVYGDGSIPGQLGELAGGVNLLEGKSNWSPDLESIRLLNPDVIFIQIGDFDFFESHEAVIESFKNQPGMTGLTSEFEVFEFNQIYQASLIDPNTIQTMYDTMYQ